MSVAVDANILLYSSNESSDLQKRATAVLDELAAGNELVYVFWPVAMAYLRIATHQRIYPRPLAPKQAVANLEALLAQPNVRSPGEGEGFWTAYRAVSEEVQPRGRLVTDAHLVTLMRQYGVRTILTRDRGFRRFDGIRVRDPFA